MAVFDDAALRELFGDRQDLIDGALRRYGEAVAEDVAALKTALQNKDIKAAESVAHRAKGAAMIVGADALAASCAEVEAAAKAGDWPATVAKTAVLLQTAGAALQAIEPG